MIFNRQTTARTAPIILRVNLRAFCRQCRRPTWHLGTFSQTWSFLWLNDAMQAPALLTLGYLPLLETGDLFITGENSGCWQERFTPVISQLRSAPKANADSWQRATFFTYTVSKIVIYAHPAVIFKASSLSLSIYIYVSLSFIKHRQRKCRGLFCSYNDDHL